jgi:hypothetical protein
MRIILLTRVALLYLCGCPGSSGGEYKDSNEHRCLQVASAAEDQGSVELGAA